MKRFFSICTLLLLIMAFPFKSTGDNKKVIDFNYPQDVSKQALSDLNKALKTDDGQMTVDALVRYSIAQSGISQDNMPDIVSRIETVIQKEKKPHIKALLYYFEALVYQGYRDNFASWRYRNNPVEEQPTDVSEWSTEQFNVKILELISKSLADPEALSKVPVKSMPEIIECNDLGATYVPTLFEFLTMKNIELLDDSYDPVVSHLKKNWVEHTQGNVPAHLFAIKETGKELNKETYLKYKDNEYSALLLDHIYFSDTNQKYKELKAYVERFPNSMFIPQVKNLITEVESKEVRVDYPKVRSSRDSIPVNIESANANNFTISIYRIPDSLIDEYHIKFKYLVPVNQYPMTVQGTIPFRGAKTHLTLPPLPYGVYYICAENLGPDYKSKKGEEEIYNYDRLRVTDLALISASNIDGHGRIGVVDIKSGKPVPGAEITYNRGSKETSGTIGKTDRNGLVETPQYFKRNDNKEDNVFTNMTIKASKGDDKYGLPISYNMLHPSNIDRTSGVLYTDLGVYRPGETMHWSAIAYQNTDGTRTPLAGERLHVTFSDTNNKLVDSITVVSDEFGRIDGTFTIPTDRMNGMFSLRLSHSTNLYKEYNLTHKGVNVSEYKTPTFEVTFPDATSRYMGKEPVKVTGLVKTYSGMPVANTEVRMSLVKNEWSWRWWYPARVNNDEHLLDTTVVTDAQGQFSFTYPPELFSENKSEYCWSHYCYSVIATATTAAGETQENSTSFIVGSRRGIQLGIVNDNVFYNDKPIEIPLTYNTTDEEHPDTYCTWEVTPADGDKSVDDAEPVLTGNLNTAKPVIDLTSLPSGKYRLKVHVLDAKKGEDGVDDYCYITLYRKTDKKPPVKDCPLWISPLDQTVDKNNVGHITIGVSVPRAHIYYLAWSHDETVAEGWLDLAQGLHDFKVPLPKKPGADIVVEFVSYYDIKLWSKDVTLYNPYKAEAMKITATSFRDKLAPGDVEHWTFTLTDQNGKPMRGAMLLDMYDKAISRIATNEWSFSNWRKHDRGGNLEGYMEQGLTYRSFYWTGAMLNDSKDTYAELPELYTYDEYLFGRAYSTSYLLGARGAAMRYEAAAPVRMAMKNAALDEMTEMAEEGAINEDAQINEKNFENIQLRECDVKTALWQPMLTSDDKGVISLEFEVPNFNTTWITQAVAWNNHMLGNTWMAEVLTQKPLMVRSSMPRFLRQGDKTRLAATVQNATDEPATADAIIELFDPRSNEVFATRTFNVKLDAMGSETVDIDWTVPDDIAFVGFRIKAANSRYGDGEQVMVPVLTTISPVIETQPFFIEASQGHFEQQLPEFPADARVTLEYCDNPVWYCVLALPTIWDDDYNVATCAAHSLFAIQVAQGVAKSQPQIKEAIDYWKHHDEDSVLVSMLQKNQDLKIGTLLASPWVRDADRQTLRMSRLYELFDAELMAKEYDKIISSLESLQMSDGGFTWFLYPECKSQEWTTGTVLELIGEAKKLGYLTEDERLDKMIKRALAYYDNENVRMLNEYKKEGIKNPYSEFTDYAYIRTLFPEVKLPSANSKLLKNTLKFMDKNWSKGLTLNEKAFYAKTLNRNGYQKTARNIVESIRQFAIVKPSLGMYWDNLQTGYGWWEYDKVAYTSNILQAMNEVDPRQDEIDQVRKWMLLMKQSNDWGSRSLAADAVYSILTTGNQWLERSGTPTITVAGQPLVLDQVAQWLGYFRTTLSATTTGSVVIDRNGSSPAWGAVYSQFKAPMTQIKEVAIEELSISKEYYVYSPDGKIHQATSFKVGDKVKVRMVIKANKDMNYVTITDERASCFEPVDQLSGYRNEDRTWFYQETKDTQTNIFMNRLSKGTHIISYDVWVTNPGEFTSGIATIQCQYAPQLSAHSAGKSISITTK